MLLGTQKQETQISAMLVTHRFNGYLVIIGLFHLLLWVLKLNNTVIQIICSVIQLSLISVSVYCCAMGGFLMR